MQLLFFFKESVGHTGALWLLNRTGRVFVNAELSTAGRGLLPFAVQRFIVIDCTVRIPALTRDSRD
jgi:hypothetical protein